MSWKKAVWGTFSVKTARICARFAHYESALPAGSQRYRARTEMQCTQIVAPSGRSDIPEQAQAKIAFRVWLNT
ncbi:hypothetical protein BXY66_1122 [Shimia isoporae]|uniref:Uncharacterized protein n=1 Tax=Shimia isoporae TaxID=647720 RepID=A0A4R1NMS7_9RHOB|nr:hypothetical protein BXY66_1122 [Shimia isoporae]